MAEIYQPKPSKGIMGSKAFGIGMGIATGNPMMAAGALAGGDSPAGKMLSIYNRFQGGLSPEAPIPDQIESFLPQKDNAEGPMSAINRRMRRY